MSRMMATNLTVGGTVKCANKTQKLKKRKQIKIDPDNSTRKRLKGSQRYALRSKSASTDKPDEKELDSEPHKERATRFNLPQTRISRTNRKEQDDRIHVQQSSSSTEIDNQDKSNLIRASLAKTVNVKHPTDSRACWVTGIAVLSTGQKLLVDRTNRKLKLYSSTMERLTSLILPEKPMNVCLFTDNIALVTTEKCVFVIDVDSDNKLMSLQRTIEFDISITRIASCRQNVYLTTNTSPTELRKINLTGDTLWAVSTNGDDEKIFSHAKSVIAYADGHDIKVAVLDARNTLIHEAADALTIVNGATGDILRSCDLAILEMHHGLAYDGHSRNFYVSNPREGVVIELPEDLSNETVRFSTESKSPPYLDVLIKDLHERPYEIAMDHQRKQLIISNEGQTTFNEIQIYNTKYRIMDK